MKGQGVFEGLIGHDRALDLLAAEVKRPAHAYFFVGPASVGKATVARRFAAALLCPESGDTECIRRVLSARHPDLVIVEPDGRTVLTVNQARTTITKATLVPVEAARKVFLFEEAGMMNESAANALLKTLEEPTASTVFVLVAESEHDLPSTVESRCRIVQFGRVADAEVTDALVESGLEDERAAEVARISGGRPGLALSLASRSDIALFRNIWLNIPQEVSPRPGDAYQLADRVLESSTPLLESLDQRHQAELEAEGPEVSTAHLKAVQERHARELRRQSQALMTSGLEILASWYADAAISQFGGAIRNRDVRTTSFVAVTPRQAVARAERTLRAVAELEANQRPRLVLASLFSDLAG
ncbi:MAG: ATP-binding protein [Acidimicrobiia bacterium]